MAEMTDAYDWRERTVLDSQGEKLGTIGQLYPEPETGPPEWALLDTDLFGAGSTFVPMATARTVGEDVQVQVTEDQVRAAPAVEGSRELLPEQEMALLRHYGLADREGSGDGAMTRSEEELRTETVMRPRTRVRLRKYIVTEMVTTTVPVRREEVRLERETITDADAVTPESSHRDEVYEVVLHEEQVVVETRVVPKERVRMFKETVTEHRTVSDEIRKEQIDTSFREDDAADL